MPRIGKTLVVALVLALLAPFAVCEEITVAAAADLNYAFKDLAARYEQKTGDKVRLSFGASGNFFSQIQSGAPYDVFFSADMGYPEKLADAGFVEKASLRTYAVGELVLWIPTNIQTGQDAATITGDQVVQILTMPAIKKIAIANPEHAPYGRAAMAMLERLGLKQKLAGKLVLGENVSQAAQFVQSGNAQAGLIPLALALSPAMKSAGKYFEVPTDLYPEIQQGVAIVTSSRHQQAARDFIDYVVSPAGSAVLRQYGFQVPSHSR